MSSTKVDTKTLILDILSKECESKGWHFIAGSNFYQNYKANKLKFDDGQLVLAADFNFSINRGRGNSIEAIRYNGYVALGRKFDDDGSIANLNETFEDKYNQRLKELTDILSYFVFEFACNNELTIISEEYSNELNKFDTNIDFVVCRIVLEQ